MAKLPKMSGLTDKAKIYKRPRTRGVEDVYEARLKSKAPKADKPLGFQIRGRKK